MGESEISHQIHSFDFFWDISSNGCSNQIISVQHCGKLNSAPEIVLLENFKSSLLKFFEEKGHF